MKWLFMAYDREVKLFLFSTHWKIDETVKPSKSLVKMAYLFDPRGRPTVTVVIIVFSHVVRRNSALASLRVRPHF